MTHDELVDIGKTWLHSRCPVVVTELAAAAEIADCLGYDGRPTKDYDTGQPSWGSILIECKTSRRDYLTDQKKLFRQFPEQGMGNFRFYLTEKGLLDPEEISEKWGLLETTGKRVKIIKKSVWQSADIQNEKHLLISAFRRVQVIPDRCVSIRYYTIQTKCKASISVEAIVEESHAN